MSEFVIDLQKATPKAWKYFIDFYENDFEHRDPELDSKAFNRLPFEYQFGVFVSFLDGISMDVQLYATDTDALKEAVQEAFETYEEYLFLDS